MMVLVAVVQLSLTLIWILRPSEARPTEADAALVLVGGRGERLRAVSELASDGVVDHIVFAAAQLRESSAFQRLCASDRFAGVTLHCIDGAPRDTRSEARSLARYASSQGWDHVVVVTSTYHLTRAKLMVSRCFAGTVDGVAATPDSGPAVWFGQVLHEWAGLAESQVRRGC